MSKVMYVSRIPQGFQVKVPGIAKTKTFSVSRYGSSEKAFEAAVAHRNEILPKSAAMMPGQKSKTLGEVPKKVVALSKAFNAIADIYPQSHIASVPIMLSADAGALESLLNYELFPAKLKNRVKPAVRYCLSPEHKKSIKAFFRYARTKKADTPEELMALAKAMLKFDISTRPAGALLLIAHGLTSPKIICDLMGISRHGNNYLANALIKVGLIRHCNEKYFALTESGDEVVSLLLQV